MREKSRIGPDASEELKDEKELDIADQNVDMDSAEERPGVGYEIFSIGTGD